MIVTFTPNPALDVTYTLDRLDVGESQRVDPPRVRAGGKGLNVARVVLQTGERATAVTTAGGATGCQLAADLEAAGIPFRAVDVPPETRRSIAIVETDGSRATLLNERGDALTANDWNRLREALTEATENATCVTASGSVPEETPDDVYANVVTLTRSRGIPAIVDATGPRLLAAAEAGAALLKPNRAELAVSTGLDDPVAGARRLLHAGAERVIVSLGEEGMIAVVRDPATPVWHGRLPEPLPGNPTGAGDAAVAALAVCLAGGIDDLPVLVRRATAWSAAAVLVPHAGELASGYRDLESQIVIETI